MRTNIIESDWQDSLWYWQDVADGIDRPHLCPFCEMFSGLRGCTGCPLSIGNWRGREEAESDCWNPNHPWYAWHHNPTRQNAQAVYDFIAQKYEEWKVKNA